MQGNSPSSLNYQGTTIGNYCIVNEIDSGGSGTVFLAEHTILTDRRAAIKLLHSHLNTSEDRNHFLHEARLLEKLKHSHILPIYDVGFYENQPYIITEYAVTLGINRPTRPGYHVPAVFQIAFSRSNLASGSISSQHLNAESAC